MYPQTTKRGEIKLRYFWKKKWHYIDLSERTAIDDFKVYYHQDKENKKSRLYEWIGVTDRKGNDIYDGDLIATFYTEKLVNDENGAKKIVKQTGYAVQHVMKINGGFYTSTDDDFAIGRYIEDDVVEVIGNVKESPELFQMIEGMDDLYLKENREEN